ncbi:MAG: hypothetical protein J6A69_03780 [Clostridia bacterium]|nr:hypothetical protein [Clostridia bacterium]
MRFSILKICYCVSLILSSISTFSMLANYYPYRVEQTKHFSNPLPITRIDKAYISDTNIIVTHNVISGIVQFFDDNGNFLNGIHLATTREIGSTQISIIGECVYLWEDRSQKIYIFENYTYIDQITDTNITSKEEFFKQFPADDLEYDCKFNYKGKLSITSRFTQKTKHVILNTKFDSYSYVESVICVVLFAVLAMFLRKASCKQ